MESVNSKEANKFYAATKYLYQINKTCFDRCVVDFQTGDISAMEKECANACIKKHLTIFKDVVQPQWISITTLKERTLKLINLI